VVYDTVEFVRLELIMRRAAYSSLDTCTDGETQEGCFTRLTAAGTRHSRRRKRPLFSRLITVHGGWQLEHMQRHRQPSTEAFAATTSWRARHLTW
jgi:hypothetical protein